jgi:hypothetical protein
MIAVGVFVALGGGVPFPPQLKAAIIKVNARTGTARTTTFFMNLIILL